MVRAEGSLQRRALLSSLSASRQEHAHVLRDGIDRLSRSASPLLHITFHILALAGAGEPSDEFIRLPYDSAHLSLLRRLPEMAASNQRVQPAHEGTCRVWQVGCLARQVGSVERVWSSIPSAVSKHTITCTSSWSVNRSAPRLVPHITCTHALPHVMGSRTLTAGACVQL